MKMLRGTWITTLAAVGAVVMVMGLAGTAQGAGAPFYCWHTCHHKDARHDAPARADLTRATVSVGQKAFRTTFRVRNLKRTGSFVLGAGIAGWGTNYFVWKRAHRIIVKERTVSEVRAYKLVRCRHARVRWNARTNTVHARFPFACSGGRGDAIINGLYFHSHGATDRMGRVFFKP